MYTKHLDIHAEAIMTTPVIPPVDDFLCFALYSTSLSMTQRYKSLLQALDVTYPQYLVLLVLWNEEGLGIKEIAKRLHQDPGSITPLVKRLETQGYLTRRRDAEDERQLVITLTAKGKQAEGTACDIRQSVTQACGANDAELDALLAALLKLRQRLDE